MGLSAAREAGVSWVILGTETWKVQGGRHRSRVRMVIARTQAHFY